MTHTILPCGPMNNLIRPRDLIVIKNKWEEQIPCYTKRKGDVAEYFLLTQMR